MEQKTMKWRKSALLTAAMLLLAALTGYILMKDHSMGTLWAVLKTADMRFVLLGTAFMVLFTGCEAFIIRLLFGTWKTRVPWIHAMQYSFAGFYFSSITPSSTGGQPMQLYYMVRDGLSTAKSSFVLLTITAMYQFTALGYGVVMAALRLPYIMGLPTPLKLLLLFGIAANGLSAAFILLILFCRPLIEHLVRLMLRLLGRFPAFPKERAGEKAKAMIEEYSQGGAYLRSHLRAAAGAAFLTFCQLSFLYLASYCACLALGLGGVGIGNFLMLQAVVSLAVSAVPLPGAVGASESGFLTIFRGFFTSSQLFPLMVLSRGISFYGFLVISGVAVAVLHIRRGRPSRSFSVPSAAGNRISASQTH